MGWIQAHGESLLNSRAQVAAPPRHPKAPGPYGGTTRRHDNDHKHLIHYHTYAAEAKDPGGHLWITKDLQQTARHPQPTLE